MKAIKNFMIGASGACIVGMYDIYRIKNQVKQTFSSSILNK